MEVNDVENIGSILKRVYPSPANDKTANDSHTKRKKLKDIVNKILGRKVMK